MNAVLRYSRKAHAALILTKIALPNVFTPHVYMDENGNLCDAKTARWLWMLIVRQGRFFVASMRRNEMNTIWFARDGSQEAEGVPQ